MIQLQEPLWGKILSKNLYYWMLRDDMWVWMIPLLADVFVFFYPIYLLFIFLWGAIKKKFYYQSSALFTFFSVLISVGANIFIQFFVDKVRPNILLGLTDFKSETILHKFLPSSSFPSDHAAVGMAFASAVFFWGLKNKDKKFIIGGIIFYVFGLIMNFARVSSGVHRPTDVIAGSVVGIGITRILFYTKIFDRLENRINRKLVGLWSDLVLFFSKVFGLKN